MSHFYNFSFLQGNSFIAYKNTDEKLFVVSIRIGF